MPRSPRAHSTFAAALFLAPLLALDPTEALAQGNMTVSTALPDLPTPNPQLIYQAAMMAANQARVAREMEEAANHSRVMAFFGEINKRNQLNEKTRELEASAHARKQAIELGTGKRGLTYYEIPEEKRKEFNKLSEEIWETKKALNKLAKKAMGSGSFKDWVKSGKRGDYKKLVALDEKLLKAEQAKRKFEASIIDQFVKDANLEGREGINKSKYGLSQLSEPLFRKSTVDLPASPSSYVGSALSRFGIDVPGQPVSTSIALDENKMISLNGYTGRSRTDPGSRADTDGLSLLYMVTDDRGADKKRYWGLNGGVGEGKVTSLSSPDITSIDSWNIAALGGLQWQDGAYMSTSVGYSENRSKSRRFTADGGLPAVALGTFTGKDTSGSLELGKTYRLGKRADEKDGEEETASARRSTRAFWELAPQMSVQLRHFEQDAFTETGAGASSLNIGVIQVDTFQTSVGARLSRPTPTSNGGTFIPQLTLRYAHEFGDTHANIVSSFVGTSTTVVSESSRLSRDSVQVSAGAILSTRDSWDLSASYLGQFASNYDNQTATATVSYRFD